MTRALPWLYRTGGEMSGIRFVPAWDNGHREMGAHWIKEGSRGTRDDTLDSFMQIDHVIQVHADGTVADGIEGVYAPEVLCDVADDGFSVLDEHERSLVDGINGQGWTVEWGWSHQNSGRYGGPIMHDTEFVGGALAEHVLSTPGYWVCSMVGYLSDVEPEGWLIMHREAE